MHTPDTMINADLGGSLGARPNSSGEKSRELGLGLETLAAFPCALAECSLEARLLPGERVWQTESLFLVFRQSKIFFFPKMGVAEMGVVTMLKLAGYYLYSRTDLVRFEKFSVLKITFLVYVYGNLIYTISWWAEENNSLLVFV